MREFIKVMCVVAMLFGVPIAAIAWFDDRPTDTTWIVRVVSTVIPAVALALFLKMHFRKDAEPDFLRQQSGDYFNRDGFCFAFGTKVVDDTLFLEAWFQNQYEMPCQGRIALRPSYGFFLNRPDIEAIVFDIECGPAAFGVASLPLALPREFQGKRHKFDVGASVEYLPKKGKQFRFYDGLVIRTNSNFGNPFGSALTTMGAVTGSLILSSPASITIEMPVDVTEGFSGNAIPTTRTLWELKDGPISTNSP